jgi:uncharacterized RDD family membrane protein YckC
LRTIQITTPENVQVTYTLAGPGSRFLALLLDSILRTLATLVILLPIVLVVGLTGFTQWFQGLAPWLVVVPIVGLVLIWGVYFLLFETLWNGQTPGKRMLGLRVLRDQGLPVDFRAVVLRNVMRLVDALPWLYAVGGICSLLNDENKRLGDMVAGTIVTAERAGELQPLVALVASPLGPRALEPEDLALLDLHQLQEEDWYAIETYLKRRPELDPGTAGRLSWQIAGPLLQRLGLTPERVSNRFDAFLEELAEEYQRREVL